MSWTLPRPSRGELLAPAGDLTAGLLALESGADALYLGLSEFSARRAARNFSLRDFARIKAAAEKAGARVYAAMNILLRDGEPARAAGILLDLKALGVDGIIVQDLGLLAVLREHFPDLSVHASTQMGVHNSAGVEVLKRLGARRVVLSRELSFQEIRRIRDDHPDMELEVFIHGALCYSFSGLCLASGLMLGRSGNRGDCAQICRTWFQAHPDEGAAGGAAAEGFRQRGYFFSCNDLAARDDLLRLRDLGVAAFKIEGRMKPPAWVAAVTAYYRAVLDGTDPRDAEEHVRRAQVLFSRRPTRGHLPGVESEGLLSPDYPGHRGLPAGRVAELRRGVRPGLVVKLTQDLAVRDALLYFAEPGAGGLRREEPGGGDRSPREPVRFSVEGLETRTGKTSFARAGEEVFIPRVLPSPPGAPGDLLPPPGTELFKIALHDSRTPEPGGSLAEKKIPLDLQVRLLPDGVILSVSPEPWIPRGLQEFFPAAPEPGRVSRPFLEMVRERLSPPGDSLFSLGNFHGINDTGFPSDGIYLNPSRLKEMRRSFYRLVDEAREEARKELAAAVLAKAGLSEPPGAEPPGGRRTGRAGEVPPPLPPSFPRPAGVPWRPFGDGARSAYRPPLRELLRDRRNGLPFAADFAGLSPDDLHAGDGGRLYLPLAPVLFDAEAYVREAEAFVRRVLEERPRVRVVLGLGNVGHFRLASSFRDEARVEFFADYGLHIANGWALELFLRLVPRPLCFYPWIEGPRVAEEETRRAGDGVDGGSVSGGTVNGSEEAAAPGWGGRTPALPRGEYGAFMAPLFISRVCVFRHGLPKPVAPSAPPGEPREGSLSRCRGCSGDRRVRLTQGKRSFILQAARVAGSCLNLLFPGDGPSTSPP